MVCFVKLGTTFTQLHFGVLALNRVVFGEIVDSFDEFGTVGKVSSSSTIMGPGLPEFDESGVPYNPYKISRKSRLKLVHFLTLSSTVSSVPTAVTSIWWW